MLRNLEVRATPAAIPTPNPVAPRAWDKSPTPSPLERCNLRANSTGDASLRTHCIPLLLLAMPLFGFSQQDPEARYTAVVAAAQQAMSRSEFKTAAENYQQAVKIHPESAEMWANLGLMEHESGEYAEAMKSFERAIHLKPSLYVANLFLGIDSLHAGNTRAAI